MKRNNRRLDIRLDSELYSKLNVLLKVQGMNKSELLRDLIWDKYDDLEKRIGFDECNNLLKEFGD